MAAPPPGKRFIDLLPEVEKRPVEMQVLNLGLSRTGTTSMVHALDKLGYKAYHFTETIANQKGTRHVNCWIEALQAKIYGKGKPFTSAEFDKLLKNYSAITDAPCVNFIDEMLAAYPNAKVILTLRDPMPWTKSMENVYYRILDWRIWPVLRKIDPWAMGALYDILELILIDWAGANWQDRDALRAGALRHNEHVRRVVPKDRLLEFRVQEGWEPLCKFLGKPIPNEPFPRVNGGNDSPNMVKVGLAVRGTKLIGFFWLKVFKILAGPVGALVLGYYMLKHFQGW